jgi:hypothetical protein
MLDELVRDGQLGDLVRRVLHRIPEKAWLDLTCEFVPAGQPAAESPRIVHWRSTR